MILPLQIGGIMVLLAFLFFIAWIGVAVIAGYYIYSDASKRGNEDAIFWGIGIAILFFLGIVPGILGIVAYYLLQG